MISTLAKLETVQLIPGPSGKIEAVLGEPTGTPRQAWGIVCHPHPQFGGTMNNKVVTTLTKMLQHLGLNTIRFNFRGVGQSEGEFDQGEGEVQDLLAVLEWAQQHEVHQEIWLAGFSFGAYIAAKAATLIPVKQLITVAPPVENFPMRNLPPILSPWILAQGDQDEVVSAKEVIDWAESLDPKPIILRFPEASHFFHGQLSELRTKIEEALLKN